MKGKTCCVTGHRTIPESELERVREELEREIRIAVAEGYTHFISGFAEGADLLFADIVLRLKQEYPYLTLEAALPYAMRVRTNDREFHRLFSRCDKVTVLAPSYHAGCYGKRNRYMVDHAARLIAVFDGQDGGTRRTVEYALRSGLEVVYVVVE
mgnify:CR=1 FL=1